MAYVTYKTRFIGSFEDDCIEAAVIKIGSHQGKTYVE